jgi:predicted  nucleic acid-binding Zn-ribbon protein
MNLDALTEALEAVLERAQTELSREVTAAKKIVDGLNIEKQKAQTEIDKLANEHTQAKVQLDTVLANLQKGSALAGLSHDITTARKTLEGLKIEITKAETAVAALRQQQGDEERRLLALRGEVQALVQVRSQSEAAMADIRMTLRQVQLGQQS